MILLRWTIFSWFFLNEKFIASSCAFLSRAGFSGWIIRTCWNEETNIEYKPNSLSSRHLRAIYSNSNVVYKHIEPANSIKTQTKPKTESNQQKITTKIIIKKNCRKNHAETTKQSPNVRANKWRKEKQNQIQLIFVRVCRPLRRRFRRFVDHLAVSTVFHLRHESVRWVCRSSNEFRFLNRIIDRQPPKMHVFNTKSKETHFFYWMKQNFNFFRFLKFTIYCFHSNWLRHNFTNFFIFIIISFGFAMLSCIIYCLW